MRTRGLETRVEMLGWISPQGSDLEEVGYLEMSLLLDAFSRVRRSLGGADRPEGNERLD